MLLIKPGVKFTDLTPQILLGVIVVASVYEGYGAKCTITSVNDGKHSDNSLHYKGRAADFRTKDFVGDKVALVTSLKVALSENFDVVLEHVGAKDEHIHVEYDPKP